MNVLYIGRFYPPRLLKSIASDSFGKASFANHNFELSILRGLQQLNNINLRVITLPRTYSFPHNNKKPYITSDRYELDGVQYTSVGYCNIVGLNKLSMIQNLKHIIKKEILEFDDNEIAIIVNTPSYEISKALFNAVNNNRKIKTTLIVPDVPECLVEMDNISSLKGKLINYMNRRNAELSLRYNKYVFLTKAMNDFYHAKANDYIVMEGLIDTDRIHSYNNEVVTNGKEIILYSGTLRRIFGVMNLIDVFTKGNFKNTELWICGSGEAASDIETAARHNNNIKFFGLVSSQEARRLQSLATILANPRSENGRYTKYSFPSKTIEYLMAGKSVIMNRLPGIPPEYDKFLFYPESESIEDWIIKLKEIMNMDWSIRQEKNQSAQAYIEDNKSAKKQCQRIVQLAFK